MIPPLAPPKGKSKTADFQVIREARARVSSIEDAGERRKPPLKGPRLLSCWTLFVWLLGIWSWREREQEKKGVEGSEHFSLSIPKSPKNKKLSLRPQQHLSPVAGERPDLPVVHRDHELGVDLALRREEELAEALRVVELSEGLC